MTHEKAAEILEKALHTSGPECEAARDHAAALCRLAQQAEVGGDNFLDAQDEKFWWNTHRYVAEKSYLAGILSTATELEALRERVAELEGDRTLLANEVRRSEDLVVHLSEYWNKDDNEKAMSDACWHTADECDKYLDNRPAAVRELLAKMGGGR